MADRWILAGLLSVASSCFGAVPEQAPLPVPPEFDPAVQMINRPVNGQSYHPTFHSAEFTAKLVANGTPEDLKLAEAVLQRVMESQERNAGAAHYGGFRWFREEEAVEDLNAVEFTLYYLIPMMLQYQDRLTPKTRREVLESIRLGLEEVRRVDVGLKYTNVVIKDITNSSLGGELLGDRAIAGRGYRKLADWMAFTDQSGGIYEYNSVPYTGMSLRYLATLAKFVKDDATRVRAKTMLARLALTIGLHADPATGRWAGPHSRAYYPTVMGVQGAYLFDPIETKTLKGWIAEGVAPRWLQDLLARRAVGSVVEETASVREQLAATTYFSTSFALGVASRSIASNRANRYIAWESNPFTLHYTRPESHQPGSVFSRYVVNDEWSGGYSPGPGRAPDYFLRDSGLFQGVQDRERAIALYAPGTLGALATASSAKVVIGWPRWNPAADQVWIGDKSVTQLPAEVPRGSTVAVASGDAMTAIRPLTFTDLGANASLRLVLKDGALLLEMYNYLGPEKTFWELASPGDFFHGVPQAGFYAEVAERSAFVDAATFGREVSSGRLEDRAESLAAYGHGRRLWRVEYGRSGRTLGIEVDLMNWDAPARRWTQAGELGWPMFDSPWASESRSGVVRVGDAVLTTGSQPAWLFASPSTHRWVAAYHGPGAAPLKLELPGAKIEIPRLATGLVVWDNGKVTVDAIGLEGSPKVTGGELVKE